jgi:hypothetical protein
MISPIIALFYLYFGGEAYLAVLVGAIYKIGINLYMVLWAGAYNRTPIDLRSSKKFLEIKNLSILLIIYVLVHYLIGLRKGYVIVTINGVLGFAFKGLVFKKIGDIYKKKSTRPCWRISR